MGHLIDQPASPLQRLFQCAQRTIAIVVVGCAALALWAGPAIAADPPATDSSPAADSPPATPASAADESSQASTTPAPTAAGPDLPPPADQAGDTGSAPAPETSLASAPAAPTSEGPKVGTDATQGVAETVASQGSDPIDVPTGSIDMPAQTPDIQTSSSVDNAIRTGQEAGHTTLAAETSNASVASAVHALPSESSQQSSIYEDIARLTSDQPASSDPPASNFDRGDWTPPLVIDRSGPSDPRPSADSKRFALPSSLTAARSLDASGSTALPTATTQLHRSGSAPGSPELPGPLQLPGLGLADGSSTSSNGIFFFAFAILLGLLVLGGRALSKRLRSAPASWRPVPFVALLERPG